MRDEKVKVLHAMHAADGDGRAAPVVRGQYDGYRQEPNVPPASRTETYVALELLHRQLAVGGRAVLPADRQAAAAADDRDCRAVQARRRSRCSARRRSRARTRTVLSAADPAGGIHLPVVRREGTGSARTARDGEHGLQLRATLQGRADAPGTRRCSSTRWPETRRSSIAWTWSRPGGRSCSRFSTPGRRISGRRFPTYGQAPGDPRKRIC